MPNGKTTVALSGRGIAVHRGLSQFSRRGERRLSKGRIRRENGTVPLMQTVTGMVPDRTIGRYLLLTVILAAVYAVWLPVRWVTGW